MRRKAVIFLIVFLAMLSYSASAQAQFCLGSDIFQEEYEIGIIGSDGNKTALVLERKLATTRAAYGAAIVELDTYTFSWEHQFPGGSVAWFCEIDRSTNTGPGTVIQLFTTGITTTPFNCDIRRCSTENAVRDLPDSEDLAAAEARHLEQN